MKVQMWDCIYVIQITKLPKKQHYYINKVCKRCKLQSWLKIWQVCCVTSCHGLDTISSHRWECKVYSNNRVKFSKPYMMCRTASKLVESFTGTTSGTTFLLSRSIVDMKDEKLYCIQPCNTYAYNTHNMILD